MVRAHGARERDDRDGAREAFERALDQGLLDLPHGPTWMVSLTWAADICAWLEDRPRAARLYDQLAPFAGVMMYQYGPVGRAVGRLAQTLERPDEAEQLLRDAVALCERINARAFLAMARQDLGDCCSHHPRAAGSSSRRAPPPTNSASPGLTKRAVATYE